MEHSTLLKSILENAEKIRVEKFGYRQTLFFL